MITKTSHHSCYCTPGRWVVGCTHPNVVRREDLCALVRAQDKFHSKVKTLGWFLQPMHFYADKDYSVFGSVVYSRLRDPF